MHMKELRSKPKQRNALRVIYWTDQEAVKAMMRNHRGLYFSQRGLRVNSSKRKLKGFWAAHMMMETSEIEYSSRC